MDKLGLDRLQSKFMDLTRAALIKLRDLTNQLIAERQEILKENEEIKKEMELVKRTSAYNADSLKSDRKIYYALRGLVHKGNQAKELVREEVHLAKIARSINSEGKVLLEEIADFAELETKQLQLNEKEAAHIKKDIIELEKINHLVQAVAQRPDSMALEQAARIVDDIQADLREREKWTREKIITIKKKKKLLAKIKSLETKMLKQLRTLINETKNAEAEAEKEKKPK